MFSSQSQFAIIAIFAIHFTTLLIAVLGSFVTDGYLLGTYETEKRKIIKEHLKNMSENDIPGMLTHLYRAQDYFTRSQKVEVFEGMVKSCRPF